MTGNRTALKANLIHGQESDTRCGPTQVPKGT